MDIQDEGLIIGQKKLGENGIVMTIFSKDNGLIKGLCKISKKKLNQFLLI